MHVDAVAYIRQKNWEFKRVNGKMVSEQGEVLLKECPFCGDQNYNFSINVEKDGAPFQCWKGACEQKGNLISLKRKLGDLDLKEGQRLSGTVGEYMRSKTNSLRKEGAEKAKAFKTLPEKWADGPHADLLKNSEGALEQLKERGFNATTIQHFKVGVVKEANGKATRSPMWVLPYFANGGIGLLKYRTVPPASKFMQREAGMESVLFNQDGIDWAKDHIILSEGEFDAMAIWQSGWQNVAGVPAGAKAFRPEWIAMLEKFEQIILVFDEDDAGKKGRSELVKRLGAERVSVVELPSGMDANEVLVELGEGALYEMIDQAKNVPIEGVVDIGQAMEELQEALLAGEGPDSGLEWSFSCMTENLGKVQGGQFWLVTGKSRIGKTTLLKQQGVEWARKGEPVLLWCGEMTPKQLVTGLVQCVMGVERTHITPDILADAYEIIGDIPFYLGYHSLNPTKDLILDMATQAYKRYGVKTVIVDNLLTITQHASDPMVEEGRVAQAFNNWCIYYDATIFLVAHPRKMDDENKIESLSDVKGNSNLTNLCAQGFSVFRENKAPKNASDLYGHSAEMLDRKTAIVPLKGRFGGSDQISWLYMEGEYSRFREATVSDFEGGGR